MTKDNSLFDAIKNINDKKDRDIKFSKANGYILSLYMAQDKELIQYVGAINPYIFELPNKLVYKYYKLKVPKKNRYIKWTAKEKESKEMKKKIDELCIKYNISPKEAKLSLRNE